MVIQKEKMRVLKKIPKFKRGNFQNFKGANLENSKRID